MVFTLQVALDNFRRIQIELADALTGFNFFEFANGFGIERDDSPEHGFLFVYPQEKEFEANSIKDAIKDKSRLYIPLSIESELRDILSMQGFSAIEQSFSIFHKPKGVHPALMEAILDAPLSIKTFSFNQRGKVDSMYERLDLLPGLITASQKPLFGVKNFPSDSSIVERVPRGLLHLFDGKFWVMEDYFENFLACAITVSVMSADGEPGTGVFFLLTPHDLSTGDYTNALLANIELQEKTDFLLIYDESQSSKINPNFGYQLLERFNLFVNF